MSAFEYSRNETVLHTDASLLPRTPKARAAWNFRTTSDDRPPVVTYWMNRLQGLDTETQFLVTLNARERIDPAAVLAVMDYRHPVYDAAAVAAQATAPGPEHPTHHLCGRVPRVGLPRRRLPLGRRGRRRVRSRVVTTLSDLPTLPALVVGHVWHRRRIPVRHEFRHRAYLWLVDLDELPQLPPWLRPLATFDARDHLGSGSAGIKPAVERYLAHQGVVLGSGDRVVMLANARVLGYVFDPLTVFWCFAADGALRCVVAEVHNTYGERHAYLLRPEADGTAEVGKEFFVSPFNDVSGRYAFRFAVSPEHLSISITLNRGDRPVFAAGFGGRIRPATAMAVAKTALVLPAMPQRASILIRAHGIWLWLRRLPVLSRPVHQPPEGVR